MFPGEINAIPIHNSKIKLYANIIEIDTMTKYWKNEELINKKITATNRETNNKPGRSHLYLAKNMHPTNGNH